MGVLAVLALATAAAQPLTLDDALSIAARRNPALAAARSDVEAASANLRIAYSGVLPRLDLSGAFGGVHVKTPAVSSGSGAHRIQLDLLQPLFTNGVANWETITAQRQRERAFQRQLDDTALQVAFGVTRAFFEVVKQRHALEVRRSTAALSADLVKRADALFSAGRGSRSDTYSARANLQNDEIAVHSQEAALEQARAGLALAIGLASSVGLDVVPPFPVTGPDLPSLDEPPPLAGLLTQARKDRPLVASVRLAQQAAETEVAIAQGGWWPSVALHGLLERQATDVSGVNGIFASPSKLYTAVGEVTFTWNLYGGGSTSAGVSLARAAAARADATAAQAEQAVASEVEVARENAASLARSARSLRPLLEASENALRFVNELLELGRSNQLEVRDAALKREQARLVWVNTVSDLAVARADLARAIGAAR